MDVYTLSTLDQITTEGDRYAVLGFPIKHSLSPVIQKAAFEACGIKANYIRLEVPPEAMPEAVEKLKAMNFKGWNCTLPHKMTMLDLIDEAGESARQLGGVNTVLNKGGKLIGYNTDGPGWVKAVHEVFKVDVRDLHIMILGLGGAGQALAIQSALENCDRLVLVNRTFEKTEHLKTLLMPLFRSEHLVGAHDRLMSLHWNEEAIAEEINHVDLIVNCTSVGLKSSEGPILPRRILQPHLMVYDTIYPHTHFLKEADLAGCRTANGLSMLLHQGALAFEIWTERIAPIDIMRDALHAAVAAVL